MKVCGPQHTTSTRRLVCPALQEPKTERVLANLGVRVVRVVAECDLPVYLVVPKCFL